MQLTLHLGLSTTWLSRLASMSKSGARRASSHCGRRLSSASGKIVVARFTYAAAALKTLT